MKKNNRVVKQYLKEVSDGLDCPRSVKSVFISEFKSDIFNYAANDIVDMDDLYDKFGTPESIADGFCDKNDYKLLLKKAKKRSFVMKLIFAVLIIILLAVIIFAALIIKDAIADINGTIIISEPY